MFRRFFLPQAVLDEWVAEDKVDLKPDRLVDLQGRQEYPIREAIRFLRVAQGVDGPGFVGKVKAVEAVKKVGAEYCRDSVILNDTAYEVEPGFLAELSDQPAIAGAPAAAPQLQAQGPGRSEADLLADFILNKQT